MAGNAGLGRPKGARNKLTRETLALVADGSTPVAFALEIMRDDSKCLDVRLYSAKIAAPYLHSRPQPEPRLVTFELPESISPGDLSQVHLKVLKSVAAGELSLEEGKDISAMLENQRRIIETADIAKRLAKLEATLNRWATVEAIQKALLQRLVFESLRLAGKPGVIAFHCPNGLVSNARAVRRMKAEGLTNGVADICLVRPGGAAAFLELKSKSGRQTPEQAAFEHLCKTNGAPYAIARTIEEAIAALASWGCIRSHQSKWSQRNRMSGAAVMDTYKSGAEALADKQAQQALLTAMAAAQRSLRKDECGAWRITGNSGHIYAWGDGESFALYIASGSAIKWTYDKKRLSFCQVTQNGDDEGVTLPDAEACDRFWG
jgi:hypothetical protein